jgi:hypothetical protein
MAQKKERTNLGVKQKLQPGVFVAHVGEEYWHFGLTDIQQYRTPLPQINSLDRGYILSSQTSNTSGSEKFYILGRDV